MRVEVVNTLYMVGVGVGVVLYRVVVMDKLGEVGH